MHDRRSRTAPVYQTAPFRVGGRESHEVASADLENLTAALPVISQAHVPVSVLEEAHGAACARPPVNLLDRDVRDSISSRVA